SSAATSPRRARSARGASPAPAAATRTSSRPRSSAPARWRCCPTSPATEMDVILLSDVEHVGLRGEVVSVARGYARNYLLPRHLAQEATPARVAELQKRDTLRARHEAKITDQAREIADALSAAVLRFEVKAGPTGSLFGSVTPTDIADELWNSKKIRVDRRKIETDPIKRIGRYEITNSLFEDIHVE